MINIAIAVLKYFFLKQVISQVVTGQNAIFDFMKLLLLVGLQLIKIPQNHQASHF